ncbi:papain-like cysteine protease family protein [Aquimarina sp. AU58]|uniref:papain-like cysteine protease family protein n=1 Tax=Aquimarina sp. AU58 TaxID=1874112 RepID=UPI000D649C97|nr:papain-like cysteine protease family protein [Aquimarina sp. AU58]
MEYNFQRFVNMNHVIQPENSYWCWAACAEKMVRGLKSKSEIGNSKCEIVSYYKNNILTLDNSSNNNDGELNIDSCCNNFGGFFDECNIGLKDKHFIRIFNQVGFECKESLEIDKLKNIDFIIDQLEGNDSPIILKLNTSLAHMVLISGYGERNNCKYVFVGDPSPGYGENYVRFDVFLNEYIMNSKVVKFWTSKVKKVDINEKNMVLDLDVPDNPEEFSKVLNSKIDRINALKSNFKVNISFIKEGLEIEESSLINENYQKYWKDLDPLSDSFCFKKVPINFYEELDLLEKIREKITHREEISDLYIVNFNDFFTTTVIRENSGLKEIKPIIFPSNYKLDSSWQEYEKFYSILQNQPKGMFFED